MNVKPIEITDIFRVNESRRLSSVYSTSESNGGRSSLSDSQSSQSSQRSRGKNMGNKKSMDSNNRTWKEHYIEMYLKEYLENLKPEEYDAEKAKINIRLGFPHTFILQVCLVAIA